METKERALLLIDGYARNDCQCQSSCQDITNLIALFYDRFYTITLKQEQFNGIMMKRSRPIRSTILNANGHEFQLVIYPIGVNKPHKHYIMIFLYALGKRPNFYERTTVLLELFIHSTIFHFEGNLTFDYWNRKRWCLRIRRGDILPLLKDKLNICYKCKILCIHDGRHNLDFQSLCNISPVTQSKYIQKYGCGWKIADKLILTKLQALSTINVERGLYNEYCIMCAECGKYL